MNHTWGVGRLYHLLDLPLATVFTGPTYSIVSLARRTSNFNRAGNEGRTHDIRGVAADLEFSLKYLLQYMSVPLSPPPPSTFSLPPPHPFPSLTSSLSHISSPPPPLSTCSDNIHGGYKDTDTCKCLNIQTNC